MSAHGIEAVVFDFAGVLFDWRPAALLSQVLPERAGTPESVAHWVGEIFQAYGGDWGDFDSGLVEVPALVARISARTGLRPDEVRAVVDAVPPSLAPLQGTVELLRQVKAAGWPVHFLSNMPEPYAAYLERHHAFIGWFDSGVYSARAKASKPDAAIYRQLEELSGRRPAALLFIDDHRPNVEAALARGWQAVHFTNPQALAADLARLGLLGT